MAEFAYNNRQYLSTGRSSFLVNLGRHSNIYEEDKRSTQKVQEVDGFIQKIKKARIEVEKCYDLKLELRLHLGKGLR